MTHGVTGWTSLFVPLLPAATTKSVLGYVAIALSIVAEVPEPPSDALTTGMPCWPA